MVGPRVNCEGGLRKRERSRLHIFNVASCRRLLLQTSISSLPFSIFSLSLSLFLFCLASYHIFKSQKRDRERETEVERKEWGIAAPMLPEEGRQLAAELLTITAAAIPTVLTTPSTSSSSLAATRPSSLRSRSLSPARSLARLLVFYFAD